MNVSYSTMVGDQKRLCKMEAQCLNILGHPNWRRIVRHQDSGIVLFSLLCCAVHLKLCSTRYFYLK